MNVFELSLVTSPLVGAITGGVYVSASGLFRTVVGIFLGSMIGIAVYLLAIGFSTLIMRVPGMDTKADGLSPLQWLASLVAVLIPAAAPFAAWWLTLVLVTKGLQL